jgi:hypothetical protein
LLNGNSKGGSDKIRIKKYQHKKIEEWCQFLNIPVSSFVEDAINFYVQYLEGKQFIAPSVSLDQIKIEPEIDNEDQVVLAYKNLVRLPLSRVVIRHGLVID